MNMVAMGIFHRSSSSSFGSRSPSTVSNHTTPRTSTESESSNHLNNPPDNSKDTSQVEQAPLLKLPVELIRHITSYLGPGASASFSLSSRYIYYALGTACLTRYINASKNRFAKRQTIEAIVERAFPGHWFCAWCDVFHAWEVGTGPTKELEDRMGKVRGEITRDCAESNSYLDAGEGYVLRFHHIRLALAHSLHGPDHGIPLDNLTFTNSSIDSRIYRTPVPTSSTITPKISSSGTLLLHSTFTITLPAWCTSRKHILGQIWNTLPHILVGHRDLDNGHTGLMAAIDNVVRRGWKYPFTQSCGSCRTDWNVNSYELGGKLRLVIQTWRDLGNAQSPFDQSWRAHGVPIISHQGSHAPSIYRNADMQAGDVRRTYESPAPASEGTTTLVKKQRAISPARIYQAFMRRESGEEARRSRARPNVWRTRSEDEEVQMREEEGRREVARQVAESLVRLDAWRRTRA